jgi:divalent metal cation (Fe/Co/Zn/Cd) transporter
MLLKAAVGIAVAVVSIIVMPVGFAKRRLAEKMASRVLRADAAETFLCSWLSVILLVGLLLNASVGWWWADPVAALAIAWLALREGREGQPLDPRAQRRGRCDRLRCGGP